MSWGQLPDNPFVGLRPFESHESLLFFGRHEQTVELLEQLHATRFLAVVGSSGSGKSSLVRAGLIPKLKAGFLVEDRDAWRFAIFKPGDSPLANLAAALGEALGDAELTGDEIRERGLVAILEGAGPALAAAGANLFVLADQFEELFRFGLHTAGGARGEEAAHFVALLLELARQRETPIYVAMTMRSDFLGDCDAFLGLPEAMNRSQYLVPRLTRRQRREAIAAPIRLYRAQVAPRLVDRLLNETIDARDDLPVLQHALMRTWAAWKRDGGDGAIDVEHYEQAGTIERALSDHAEEAMAGMSEGERQLTRRIFQALTETDPGNRRIRRPARLSEIEAITGASRAEVLAIVDRFRSDGRSFLVVSREDAAGDASVDISHESLIRQWERLKGWVDEEAESARTFLRLAEWASLYAEGKGELYRGAALQVASAWEESQKPRPAWARRYGAGLQRGLRFLEESRAQAEREALEKERQLKQEKRRKRTALVAVLLGIGLLAAVALTLFAVQKKGQADRAAENAELARLSAELSAFDAQEERARATRKAARQESLRALAERKAAEAERQRQRAEFLAAQVAEVKEREAAEARAEAARVTNIARARKLESAAEEALGQSGSSLLLSALLATESLAAADTPEGRKAMDRVLPLLPQALTGLEGPAATALAFSPDGERIALAWPTDTESARQSEHELAVRSRRSGADLADGRVGQAVDQLLYSPDGRLLVASSRERSTVLDAEIADTAAAGASRTLEVVHQFEHDSAGDRRPRIAFSPDGSLLAAAAYSHVLVFRTDSWEERRFEVPGAALIPYFGPEGRLLFSANAASTTVIDLGQETPEPVHLMETLRPTALAMSGDGRRMAVSTHDVYYAGEPDWRAWRSGSPEERDAGRVAPPHQLTGRRLQPAAWSLTFGPAGELLSLDRETARLLTPEEDGIYAERQRFPGTWMEADLSRDGRWAATSGTAEEPTLLWYLAFLDDSIEQRPFGTERDHHWRSHEAGWTPNGERFLLVDGGGLSVYDPATWTIVASVPFECGEPGLSFGPAQRLLLVRCAARLHVVAMPDWRRLAELDVAGATAVRFSPDRGIVAAIGEKESLITVDLFDTAGWLRLAGLELLYPDNLEWERGDKVVLSGLRWRPDRRQVAIDSQAREEESWTRRSVNPQSATNVRETLVWDLERDSRDAWRRQIEHTRWEEPSSGIAAASETTRSEESDGDGELLTAAEAWPASPPEPEEWEPGELTARTRGGVLRVRSERVDDLIDEACSRIPGGFTAEQAAEHLGDESARGACAGRATAHRARGRDLARLGYLPAARAAFERARELDPELGLDPARELALFAAQGALEEGRALALAGQLEEARARLREALELNPELILDPEAELRRFSLRPEREASPDGP